MLPKAAIAATWQPVSDSTYQVTLKSKTLAREVNLSLAEDDGFFGDNYFDLLPGETKVLTFKSEGATSLDKLRKQLVVRTLAERRLRYEPALEIEGIGRAAFALIANCSPSGVLKMMSMS